MIEAMTPGPNLIIHGLYMHALNGFFISILSYFVPYTGPVLLRSHPNSQNLSCRYLFFPLTVRTCFKWIQ